jgi:hypothetical protein
MVWDGKHGHFAAESLGDSGGVFLFVSRHRNRVGEEVSNWKMYGHVRRIVQTVNENGKQTWVKKPGSHFDVTVYRTQSDVLICRREKRHL